MKQVSVSISKALIISFVILTTNSDVMINENVEALSSSFDLTRLINDHKFQTIQQKVLQNDSQITSTIPPEDFAFVYSFGIVDETNNTISSEHNIYIKDNDEGNQSTNITFALSEAQMQAIWSSIVETGFFQIENNFTQNCDEGGNCVLVTPEHYSILKVTGNSSTHTVIAHEGYVFSHNEEYQKFHNLVDEIDRMIETVLYQNDNANNNNNNDKALSSNDREPERGFI